MFYTIYKITNQINGKIYIGSHKTRDLNDDYMGSGKYLKRSQEKYGIENFKKEILFIFDNPEEMYAKESEIVNEDFISEHNTYNVKVGGFGGFDYINENPDKFLTEKRLSSLMTIEERCKRWKEKYNNDPTFKELIFSNLEKAKNSSRLKHPEGTFKGKKHKEETKDKMSVIAKQRLIDPTKNSQFGTMWIHNIEEKKNLKIKKNDQIPEGWCLGRKMKWE